jgi:uncharacterized protein (TIGR02266 family)
MENRRSLRVSLMAELTYQVDGVATTKRVTDVSEGGLFIDTPVPSEVGTPLTLRFLLDGEPVTAEGTVVYAQRFIGMGVEFTSLSEPCRAAIRRYISRSSLQAVNAGA